MNDKLILRAAAKFKAWMDRARQDNKTQIITAAKYDIDRISVRIENASQWMKKIQMARIPKVRSYSDGNSHTGLLSKDVYRHIIQNTIAEAIDSILIHAKYASTRLKSIDRTDVAELTLKDLIEEIKAINDGWCGVEFRDNTLKVPINNVCLSDTNGNNEVSLGDFNAELNLSNPINGIRVSGGNNYSASGLSHPHIRDEHLCFGEGEDMASVAVCQGRLEDYFRIIEAIVRTYNEGGAYEGGELVDWYEPDRSDSFICANCEEWTYNDDGRYYECCDISLCEACDSGGYCNSCGGDKCEECMNICEACDECICNKCSMSCGVCCNHYCDSCTSERICDICQNTMCDECAKICPECEKEVCVDCCGNICSGCGHDSCDRCCESHECLLQES